jgi:thymidylate kinase
LGEPDGNRPTATARARGRFVVVAGPDGTGKSTVVDALLDDVLTGPTMRMHHRPHLLGRTPEEGVVVTEPHREDPYPRWLSRIKLLYLLADHVLGWFLRMRPWLRRGGDVLLERGWWDLTVDPRRYRLREDPALVRLLGRLLPRPDVTVVLGGDPATIAARKGELSVEETARQLAAWRAVPGRVARAHHVDTCRPLSEVTGEVAAVVAVGRGTWSIGLPRPGSPRWILPTSPRRVAAASLGLYQPVTARGRIGWEAARAVAAGGGFRLLQPLHAEVPADLLEVLAPHLPPRGHLAVARGNHPGRCAALLLDATGRPVRFVKVGRDDAGVAALAQEADASTWAAPLLPAGLGTPALLHREAGLLVFEAVTPVLRRRPWQLTPELATLLGRFHRAGAEPDGTGPAHGDCAPWNLLWTARGWCLVDWADARPDAPPFEDLFHHLLQAHALLGRPRADALLEGVRGRGPVADVIAGYADGAGIGTADVEERFVDHLRRSSRNLDPAAADERAGLRARAALDVALTGGTGGTDRTGASRGG